MKFVIVLLAAIAVVTSAQFYYPNVQPYYGVYGHQYYPASWFFGKMMTNTVPFYTQGTYGQNTVTDNDMMDPPFTTGNFPTTPTTSHQTWYTKNMVPNTMTMANPTTTMSSTPTMMMPTGGSWTRWTQNTTPYKMTKTMMSSPSSMMMSHMMPSF